MSDAVAVVIDNGSFLTKAGFAGDNAPRAVFPTAVCRSLHVQESLCIGEETSSKSYSVETKLFTKHFPIQRGIVTNWDELEKIWHHTFYNELCVDPKERPALLTAVPTNPKENNEKIAQVMFETFDTPNMYLANHSSLALYANARTAGLVIDIGDGVSHASPIHEGCSVSSSVQRLALAGTDITNNIRNVLSNERCKLTNLEGSEIARQIKAELCYFALDYEEEMRKPIEAIKAKYKLPDGQVLDVGNERFRCTEFLFQPSTFGIESQGIHELANKAIVECDVDIHHKLFSNIVLSGGSTLCPGFVPRLRKEVVALASLSSFSMFSDTVNIIASPGRKHSTWLGGSILSSLSSFEKMWISKQEYEEYGPCIVHQKCF